MSRHPGDQREQGLALPQLPVEGLLQLPHVRRRREPGVQEGEQRGRHTEPRHRGVAVLLSVLRSLVCSVSSCLWLQKREAIQAKRAAKKAEKERQDKRKRLEL